MPLTVRLLAIVLLTFAVAATTFQFVARTLVDRAREEQLKDARTHFTGRVASIDKDWRSDAQATRQLVELWRAGIEDAALESARDQLHDLMATILAQDDFSCVAIVDSQRRVLFRHDASLRSAPALPATSDAAGMGWVYSDADRTIYRTLSTAILFEGRPSQVIFYAPIDAALLRRLIYPSTQLTVHHGGVVLASSADAAAGNGADSAARPQTEHAGLAMAWDALPGSPELHINRQFAPPLSERQVLGFVAACAGSVILTGWFVLGRWSRSQARRLHALQNATSEFAAAAAEDAAGESDDMGRMRVVVTERPDDIGILARNLYQMMGRILRGQREQDRAQRALAALNASLEERVASRTRELEIARDAALAAARSKEQFLSSMSHEIRTPMNGMLGAMELLSNTSLTAAQARLIHVAAISGEALLDIINQVLDYAKMGAGHLHLQRESIDLNEIARSVLTLFSAAAQRKSIDIRLDADPALSGWRLGDALRIRQVLMNLVGNALKFTQHGEIVIRTRLLGTGPDERVELQVSDTGNGIDPSLHARIFDAFVQAGDPAQWRQGGTGLGLAISREIALAMGGELTVRSEVGKGATFRLVAALERAPEPMLQPARERGNPTGAVPLAGRVLLVEDNSVNRLVGAAMLESLGLEVASADNGEIALAMLAATTFDAVLMDCQMPVMDGYEATQRIREREKMTGARRMPIIALTANALRADVERCLAAGMDAHLSKPFNLGQLRAAVAPWLARGAG